MKVTHYNPTKAEVITLGVADLAPDPDIRLLEAAIEQLRGLKAAKPGYYTLSSIVLHPDDDDSCFLAMTLDVSE